MEATDPTPLDRASATPLWAQLEADLRRRLVAGAFTQRFPTDRELMDEYGVSRHTAREAVRRLTQEGMLQRHRGRGSFVNPDALEQPLGALYSLFQSIEDRGLEQRSDVLALEIVREPTAAAALELDDDTELVHLARVRHAGGEPLAVDRAWLVADLARPLLDADFTRTALYHELRERCGVHIVAGSERIQPTLPDPDDAARLAVDPGAPVFAVERTSWTQDQRVEFRHTIIRGDRYAFVADWGSAAANALRAAATDTGQ